MSKRHRRWVRTTLIAVIAVIAVLAIVFGISAHAIESSYVSKTISDAEKVNDFAAQSQSELLAHLDSPSAKSLLSELSHKAPAWKDFLDGLADEDAAHLASIKASMDKDADRLWFPDVRGRYREWIAHTKLSLTARQRAGLYAVTLAEQSCTDWYAGHPVIYTSDKFDPEFTADKTGLLVSTIMGIGLRACLVHKNVDLEPGR